MMSMTSLMIKETQPTFFFLAGRKKKKNEDRGTMLSQDQWG